MLYHFLVPLARQFRVLNVFTYISFRAVGAAVTALLLTFIVGPIILRALKDQGAHQVVREGTPDSHAGKGTTPTMGGLIILNSALISAVLWGRFSLSHPYLLIAILVTVCDGRHRSARRLAQASAEAARREEPGARRAVQARRPGDRRRRARAGISGNIRCRRTCPARRRPFRSSSTTSSTWFAGFEWLYVVFTTFILTGTSNAVNITDGLDGLASGLAAIAFGTFAIFSYIIGRVDYSSYLGLFYLSDSGELTVFCLAMVGSLIGFLWYNAHPARVFMGDTGALALGGGLGVVAILLKSEFVLAFVGAVFVAEMMSVILQRGVFKYRLKRYGRPYAEKHRVFRRAPLHHHFEELGWKESQVVVRFWIIGILCAFFALSTLKLR